MAEVKRFQVLYDYTDAPTLKRFTLSNKRVRMAMGPFGSGKSSACVMDIVRRAHEQTPSSDGIRRSRWAVVRNCYSDDTEILTEKRGWQLFKDLLPEDKVATLQENQLVYKLPTKVLKYPYKGDMIGFENEGANFLVTPEHKMWVSIRRTRKKIWGDYEVKTAEEIYGNQTVRVKRDARWKGIREDDPLPFFEWFGFWVAEGHAAEYTYHNKKVLRCAITQKDNLEYVRGLFENAKIPYRKYKYKHRGVSDFTVKITKETRGLIKQLIPLGKACVKKVPLWLKESSVAQIKSFLKGYLAGDGKHSSDGCVRASTGSKQLADDIQELALKAGEVVNISITDNTGRETTINNTICRTNGPTYILTFLKPSKYNPILYVNPKMTNKLIGWYKKPYDGFVYCVEMPDMPVYVRRKGKGLWALRSYGQLKDTTIKTFHDWFPPKLFGEYRITDHVYIITKFPGIHLEVLFRALDRPDQVSNLLSLELTGAWFNEVREIPKTIIEAMDGRIGRYPSGRDGGASWYGIIMDTNPPDEDSYLFKMFEKVRPENWEIFKQPSGLSVHAENTKHLPKNYYQKLAIGKDEMYKRIYIHGQYGYLVSGKPVFQSFVDNIHVARNPLEPIKGLDALLGFDFGLCYDDQTEVLTKSGWKYFKDVTADDLVMTKDFKTNIVEYHKPIKRIVREYTGNMILYEHNNLNFCVTPEHIIPCRKKYGHEGKEFKGNYRLTADYLYKETSTNYSIDLLSKWIGNSKGLFGPLKWKADVFAKFMGLYLSEGSCDKNNNRISIAQNKQDTMFQGILDDTGLEWKRGERSWRCSNEKLNNYLLQFGYSNQKYIPEIIKNMSSVDIERFIMSYTNGDGHIRMRNNGSIEHTVFTVSKRMADDLQELAQKIEWYAKIRVVKPQDSTIFENGKGRIIHNDGGYCITFKKRANQSRLLKKYFSKVNYSGKVYCLTVPNGTLYIRRKLTPSWNGNSPACIIGQITPLGQLRILYELISDGMGLRQFCENQLLPLLRQRYFGMNVMGFGDPSGTSRAPTDESTCFEVLQGPEVGLRNVIPAPTNAILPRIGAVEAFLNKMYQGEPGFILSPNCHFTRKALNGGYHYEKDPKSMGTDEYKPMPSKNFSSHICDALQYLCLYIDEKTANDKKWKEFAARMGKNLHQPGSMEAGY